MKGIFGQFRTGLIIAVLAVLVPFGAEFFGIGYEWNSVDQDQSDLIEQEDKATNPPVDVDPGTVPDDTEILSAADDDGVKGTQPDTPVTVPTGIFSLQRELKLCPRLNVTNAPATRGDDRVVADYKPVANVKGVELAVVPTDYACLSSGYGMRNGRIHKGVDFQGRPPGMVYAGGSGLVKEAGYRDDFGYYVLIDHGYGVYTRYAHLQALGSAAKVGSSVKMGSALGLMGNTAGYAIPVHLHYELLLGDYETKKRSFGLTAKNIFDYL